MPYLQPALDARKHLYKCGLLAEAAALENVICGKSWSGERLRNHYDRLVTEYGKEAVLLAGPQNVEDLFRCRRCGAPSETPLHMYYLCPANAAIGICDTLCDSKVGGVGVVDSGVGVASGHELARIIRQTSTLSGQAVAESPQWPCLWYMARIPRH